MCGKKSEFRAGFSSKVDGLVFATIDETGFRQTAPFENTVHRPDHNNRNTDVKQAPSKGLNRNNIRVDDLNDRNSTGRI